MNLILLYYKKFICIFNIRIFDIWGLDFVIFGKGILLIFIFCIELYNQVEVFFFIKMMYLVCILDVLKVFFLNMFCGGGGEGL